MHCAEVSDKSSDIPMSMKTTVVNYCVAVDTVYNLVTFLLQFYMIWLINHICVADNRTD